MLDAGPLIGFFYEKDTYHTQCTAGFEQLGQSKTVLLTPIPIIFEVYKWLLQNTRTESAQHALETMNNRLKALPIDVPTFNKLQATVATIPQWQGSLEDATVTLIAIQYRCPIWTYNFRDLAAFKALDFWNPEQTR